MVLISVVQNTFERNLNIHDTR